MMRRRQIERLGDFGSMQPVCPRQTPRRRGAANSLYVLSIAAVVMLAGLSFLLVDMGDPQTSEGKSNSLLLYCAAGIRVPVEQVATDYQTKYDTEIQPQYGGSNTLLNQIEVAQTGDLYVAADETYITLAREKGLVREAIPLAKLVPVIAVAKGNPKQIHSIDDLLRDDVTTAMGNPDQAAVGKKTRKVLKASGHWDRLEAHITETGVFQPTVPEVANNVKIGGVDAGIIWDSTAAQAQYKDLEVVRTAELDAGASRVMIGVLTSSKQPTAALRFARYLAAGDQGLKTFSKSGFEVAEGDTWSEQPELTFFCGSVNRRAVEPTVLAFEQREGVRVNTIYNGCGILTGQMRTITDQQQGQGFPDIYLACDRYYLENVREMFQEDVDISDTEVVIAVPKGNPKNIQSLDDLTKEGMRVTVGQPDQCTIGVLTRQLLKSEDKYDAVMKNVQSEQPTSAMLVPTVVTGSVDATLAYLTDTKAESDKVDVIRLNSQAALAIQPFSIAKSSQQKNLSRRLYQAIASSQELYEAAGFHWRLESGPSVISSGKD